MLGRDVKSAFSELGTSVPEDPDDLVGSARQPRCITGKCRVFKTLMWSDGKERFY